MTQCTAIDVFLLDGSPSAMAEAERHAVECTECRASLAGWHDLSGTAASMRVSWQSELLWPRIERALDRQRRATPFRLVRQAAAAVLLFAVLGGTLFFALRVQTARAAFDDDILRVGALDDVERAERAHIEAIERLERFAEPKLEKDASPLIVSYREKLMLLDDAIAECESNIERNRQNAYLRRQLLAMYSEKQLTLQNLLREETDASIR